MTQIFWEYEYDGELSDGEYASKEAAQAAADEWWSERCQDNEGMRNGDSYDEDIELVRFEVGDDDPVEVERIKSTVEYEHYHGDLAEHGTWHRGAGGVL